MRLLKLTPFGLFATTVEGRDDILTPVVTWERQALVVAAFQQAKEALEAIK